MKKLLLLLSVLVTFSAYAQESNGGKKLWAKSVLNEQAPKLVVEKWLGDQPQTKGKFILIDFWATWCPPCRQFIPILNDISSKHPNDLVVIGISDEPAEKVEAMATVKPTYYEAIDTRRRMHDKLEVKGIPHVILIDPNGIVRWEGFPFLQGHELTDATITALIKKYSVASITSNQ